MAPSSNDVPHVNFPPDILGPDLQMKIVKDFGNDLAPLTFKEASCAVCGQPMLHHDLIHLKFIKNLLHVLEEPGITHVEHKSAAEKICEYKGLILNHNCDYMVCAKCQQSLRNNKVPHLALCINLWIGPVPSKLSELNMVEKMLVARVQHNACFVWVNYGLPEGYGMAKMISQAIAFELPVSKIYSALPPPLDDLNDVLAVMFTGPASSCQNEYRHLSPLLVHHSHIEHALNWLILNNPDYEDININDENLEQYPEDIPPVQVIYKESDTNKIVEAKSIFDMYSEKGTKLGECSFIIHMLTEEQYNAKLPNTLKAITIKHWN